MKNTPAQILNTTSIETAHGLRTINLFYGDICESVDDVLIVSSHANTSLPPDGNVIRSIKTKYGLSFDELQPLIVLQGALGTYRLLNFDDIKHKQILVVRIPGAETVIGRGGDAIGIYERAVWSVFSSLAALELEGNVINSVSSPLLGGRRKYPVKTTMEILLKNAGEWLKMSRSASTVNFYLFDEQHIDLWSEAMNVALGRSVINYAHNQVARALADEIIVKIGQSKKLKQGHLKESADTIKNILSQEKIYLQLVAAFGRVLVENVVKELCIASGLNWQALLIQDINNLMRAKIVAPWMISHFHSLRILGNETVHAKSAVDYKPDSLSSDDLLPLLVSILRVISFWEKW